MRVTLLLPNDPTAGDAPLIDLGALAEVAVAAESAGFDGVGVSDHPFPPARWVAAGGHQALDPFVALSFVAAATSSIRVRTHLLIAPYRNPFHVAKALATLDVLSGGRVDVGLGAGYLRGEFAALGSPYDERNQRLDEAIEAMLRVWGGEPVAMTTNSFAADGNAMAPRPAQRPHPPLWIGGNSRASIDRAVRLATGWCPFFTTAALARHTRTATVSTLEELARRVAWANAESERVGRDAPLEVLFALEALVGAETLACWDPAIPAPRYIATAAALSDAGVTGVTVSLPGATSRQDLLDRIATIGRQLIPAIAEIGPVSRPR